MSEAQEKKFNPSECVTQAVEFGKAIVFVSIPKSDVKALKAFAGSIGSHSPTAFKLADCPTPQEDNTVVNVNVPLIIRTMNNKVPKATKAAVEENVI